MAATLRYPELRDFEWLHSRFVGDGLSRVEIAALIGCSSGSPVGKALRALGIERPPGWTRPATNGAPEPTFDAIDLELAELVAEQRHDPELAVREFVPTLPDADHALPRAHDVPVAELRHRAHEGLQVLAELMDVGGEGELYDVVTALEPAQARIAVFAAAVVAQGQRRCAMGHIVVAPTSSEVLQ